MFIWVNILQNISFFCNVIASWKKFFWTRTNTSIGVCSYFNCLFLIFNLMIHHKTVKSFCNTISWEKKDGMELPVSYSLNQKSNQFDCKIQTSECKFKVAFQESSSCKVLYHIGLHDSVTGGALALWAKFCRTPIIQEFLFFFLSGFSFTDIDDSQGSRGREGTIFYSTLPLPPPHEHSDIYLQLCMWDDYHVFLIATLVFTRLLLDEMYHLIELPFDWLMMLH